MRTLQEGELVVETTLSCVSPGTELRELSLLQREGVDIVPTVPGYVKIGRVLHAGTSGLQEGQRVVITGPADTGPYKARWGGHVSHSIVKANGVISIPDGIDDYQAALARLAAISCHGFRLTPKRAEDHVAVIGLGAIGLFAAKFYECHGHHIVGFDRSPQRVELARHWGIKAEIVTETVAEHIHRQFENGADIIVDATGISAVAVDAINGLFMPPKQKPLQQLSRYVVQGSYPDVLTLPYDPFFQHQTMVLFPRDWEPNDLHMTFELINKKQLNFPSSLCTIHKPEEASEVYRKLGDRQTSLVTALFRWV
ncbi:MAG: zinc-binding alcohol dehydrogenase [Phycisphaerales bacterium]|nr:zinc-binding alcohol dehydrogenase [Phycisphaerales bacterium]